MSDKLLDMSMVAKRLDISRASAYRLKDDNVLPAVQTGPRKGYRVKESDLNDYKHRRDNDML